MPTETTGTFGLGVTLAGLGEAGTANIFPLVLSGDTGLQPSGSPYSPWRARLALVNLPEGEAVNLTTPSSSASPVRGDPEQGSITFELVLADANGADDPELCAYFADADVFPACYAAADFGPTDTVIQCRAGSVAGSGIVANSIIYWEREVFRVESVDTGADTITIVDLIPLADGSGTQSRSGNGAVGLPGHLGSYIAQHYGATDGEQPPYRDCRIYLSPQFLKDREVRCLVSRVGGADYETTFALGWVETAEFAADGGTLNVSARNVLAALADQKVNSECATFRSRDGFYMDLRLLRSVAIGMLVECDNPACSALLTLGSGLIRIGDNLNYASGTAASWNASMLLLSFTDVAGLAGMTVEHELAIDAGSVSHEVMCSNPDFYPDPTLSPFYDSVALAVADHPIDLLRQFLGTKPSNLPVTWRSFLPAAAVDDTTLIRLRDTVYAGWTWRGMVVVCDGEEPEGLLEFLTRTIVRPLGASFVVDADGLISVASLFDTADTSAPEVDGSHVLQGRGVSFDLNAGVDSLRADTAVNAKLEPMGKVFGRGAYLSRFSISRDTSVVDLEAHGLVSLADFLGLQSYEIQRYAERLARIAALFRLRPLVVALRVLATANLEPGQFRRFRVTGLRAPVTGLLESTPTLRVGLVGAVATDARTAITTCTVLLFPTQYRRIGPAAEVDTLNSDTTVDVRSRTYVEPTPYVYAPSTGLSVDYDARTFAVGDVVVCRDKHLAVLTDPTVIDTVSDGQLTVNPGFVEVGGGAAYVPVATDVITYADLGDCVDAQADDFAFFGRDRLGI